MNTTERIAKELTPSRDLPSFKAGDNITVYYSIREGEKQRTQLFKGDVIKQKALGHPKHSLLEKYLTQLK